MRILLLFSLLIFSFNCTMLGGLRWYHQICVARLLRMAFPVLNHDQIIFNARRSAAKDFGTEGNGEWEHGSALEACSQKLDFIISSNNKVPSWKSREIFEEV